MKKYSKSILSLILVGVLALGSVVTANATTSVMYGDANADSKITVQDATQISKYLVEEENPSYNEYSIVDFNGDGRINIADATDIQKMLAGRKYRYTHELYEVTTGKFDEDGLTNIEFELSEHSGSSSENKKYYSGYNKGTTKVTLFKTYDEYSRYFEETFEDFDEEFFENHSIVYMYTHYLNVTSYDTIDKLYVKDDGLYLQATTWHSMDYVLPMLAYRNYFVIVNKADVENIEKIHLCTSVDYYSVEEMNGGKG